MKIFNFLLLSVAILTIAACDDDFDIETAEIGGTWVGTAVDYTGTSVTMASGFVLTTDFVGEGYDINYTLDFSENPNVIVAEGVYSVKLTNITPGQETVQDITNIQFDTTGPWGKEGDILKITNQLGDEVKLTIVELSATTLELQAIQEQVTAVTGGSSTTTIDITYKYTRQ